jgi:hypothetical protein
LKRTCIFFSCMWNVEADLPSIKFLTQQRDIGLSIRCLFYSQISSQPWKFYGFFMEVRISNRAIVKIWLPHLLLPCAWALHSQKSPILGPHLTQSHHQPNFGVSTFHLTFLLLLFSKEHYVRKYRASTPPCWTRALKVYGKALSKAFPK